MNRRKFKKIRKITSFLVFLSILGLIFTHFIPWFYVNSTEVEGDLYFNLDMAKKSDNLEIQSLSEKIGLLTISLWSILLFSLLSYIGLTLYRIEKYELASFLILLAGGIGCLISSVIGLFFNYTSIVGIQESSILNQSLLIYVFYYPYIPFFIGSLLVLLTISYNIKVIPDSIRYFQRIIKKNREMRKKVNRVADEDVYPNRGKIEDYTESTEETAESEEEEVEDWLREESIDSDLQPSTAKGEKQATMKSEGETKRETPKESIKEYEEKLAGKPFFDSETLGEKKTEKKERETKEEARQRKAVSFENNKKKQKFEPTEKVEDETEEKTSEDEEEEPKGEQEIPISDSFEKALSSAVEKTGRTSRKKDEKSYREKPDSEEKKKDEDTKSKLDFSTLRHKSREEAREDILKFFHEQRKSTAEEKVESDRVEDKKEIDEIQKETEEERRDTSEEKDKKKETEETKSENIISVRCPVCKTLFKTEKSSDGVTRIECPSCGEKGVIK